MKAAQSEFLGLCRASSLSDGQQVAIDGTYLKADANASKIHTDKQLQQLNERIEDYYRQLDECDADENEAEEIAEVSNLKTKLEYWLERRKVNKELQEKLEASGDKQISEVDPDARLLKKNGKTTGGYNVQIAVDEKHKLVVSEQVTQDGNDKLLLPRISAMTSLRVWPIAGITARNSWIPASKRDLKWW